MHAWTAPQYHARPTAYYTKAFPKSGCHFIRVSVVYHPPPPLCKVHAYKTHACTHASCFQKLNKTLNIFTISSVRCGLRCTDRTDVKPSWL